MNRKEVDDNKNRKIFKFRKIFRFKKTKTLCDELRLYHQQKKISIRENQQREQVSEVIPTEPQEDSMQE